MSAARGNSLGTSPGFRFPCKPPHTGSPGPIPCLPRSPAPSRFIKRFCQSSGTFWANPADLWVCGQSTREPQLRSGEPGWVRLSFALGVLSEFPASELSQWMPIFPEKCNQPRFLQPHLKALFCAHTKRQYFQQPWIQQTEFLTKSRRKICHSKPQWLFATCQSGLGHNQRRKWLLRKPCSVLLEEFVVYSVYSLWYLSHNLTPSHAGF